MRHFIRGKLVAVDTETTGLDVWNGDRAFAFSFCNEEGDTAFFEWTVNPMTREVQPVLDELRAIKRFLEDESVTKAFHHADFDVRMCEHTLDCRVKGPGGDVAKGGEFHDTMFAAHVYDPLGMLGLKPLAERHVDYGTEDQAVLQKIIVRLRRKAKKVGWKISFDVDPITGRETANVQADYWLPHACEKCRPEFLKPGDREACRRYAVSDAERTMLLLKYFMLALNDRGDIASYYRELELWPVTYAMEARGVRVDRDFVKQKVEELVRRESQFEREVRRASGKKDFNLRSNPQTAWLFFDKLRLTPGELTKSGDPCVAIEALEQHAGHPVVDSLLGYRSCHKALSSFFLPYLRTSVPDPITAGKSYCLHPHFRQCGPATGRYACANPNLQNVSSHASARGVLVIDARDPFGPRKGYVWYHFDYHQIEPRIFADVADENFMKAALESGRDLHDECANLVWGGDNNPLAVSSAVHSLGLGELGQTTEFTEALYKKWGVLRQIKKLRRDKQAREELAANWLGEFGWDIVVAERSVHQKHTRNMAKMSFFLKLYGGGWRKFQAGTRCSEDEARLFLAHYDENFPRIKEYQKELIREVRRTGGIRTRYDRWLRVDREFAYRAVNYMVQGSAAGVLKDAMVKTANWLIENMLDGHLVMTIHDEIVFEIRRSHATYGVLTALKELMEDHEGRFALPLPVEVERCEESWNRKTKIKLLPEWYLVDEEFGCL